MTEGDGKKPGGGKGKLGLILALVLGVAGAGGGFALTRSGLLGEPGDAAAHGAETGGHAAVSLLDAAFVPVPPLTISLNQNGELRHLRFQAQLEVGQGDSPAVEAVMPRIVDVLNGYLRAVSLADMEAPVSLVRLRAQMLRRVQIIVGEQLVRDLLIMEFVVN